MMRFLVFVLLIVCTVSAEAGSLPLLHAGGSHAAGGASITGVSLSGTTFQASATSAGAVGALSATLSQGNFTGTWALQTTGSGSLGACDNSGYFSISGSNLDVSTSGASGTFNVCETATEAGLSNSPYTAQQAITGLATSAFSVTSPAANSTETSSFTVTGTVGSQWNNTAGFDSTDTTKLCPDYTPIIPAGTFTLTCTPPSGTAAGSYTFNIDAFESSPYTESTITLAINWQPAVTITAPTISCGSSCGFTVGTASTIGTLSSTVSSGSSTITYSLVASEGSCTATSGYANYFSVSGANVNVTSSAPAGTYTLCGAATDASATNSPQYVTISVTGSSQSIASVSLSGNTFTAGTASTIGALSATMSPASPSFSGTWAIKTSGSGSIGTCYANGSSYFSISGSNLNVSASGAAGSYNVCETATESGISNSPYTAQQTITGSSPSSSCVYTPISSNCSLTASGWALIFDDEFSGTAVNTNNWNIESGSDPVYGQSGITLENPSVSGGVLSMPVSNQGGCGTTLCSSWLISTGNLTSGQGVYLEALIQLYDTAADVSGVIWANNNGNYPEVDTEEPYEIMNNDETTMTYHDSGGSNAGCSYNAGVDLTAGYHVYSSYWVNTANGWQVTWYVDGNQACQEAADSGGPTSGFQIAQLNATFPNTGDIVGTVNGAMHVKYVHAYQTGVSGISPATGYCGPGATNNNC